VNGRPTFLNFDRPFPNHTFTALIWGNNRGKFNPPPERSYGAGVRVCVTGLVETFRGKPQIEVTDPGQIRAC
jgi:DNA/RNA endonuclease YhcR with UshA esterase domain